MTARYLGGQSLIDSISIASKWKEKLTPFDGITLYKSKEDARKEYRIVDFEQTEAYKKHIEIFGK